MRLRARDDARVQDLEEDAADGLQGEGVRVQLLRLVVQGGDRADDALGGVHEQLAQPRAVLLHERTGQVDVVVVHGPDEHERVVDVVRVQRAKDLMPAVTVSGMTAPGVRAAALIAAASKTPSNRGPVDRVRPPGGGGELSLPSGSATPRC
ncbi:hypothetical protein [Streptomyces sp. C10-9-1]|uniref:hypothetical protein n=1 Tax=Streptomyces sp. C10-9-1 TaxID=1859285 RepID=UPI003F49F4D5